jgi:hypothetical protein
MLNDYSRRFFFVVVILLFVSNAASALDMNPLNFSWKLSADGNFQPLDWQLRMEFSYPVSILEISKNVSMKMNGSKAEFKVYNATELGESERKKALDPERKVFIIQPKSKIKKAGNWEISIKKQLKAGKAKAGLKKNHVITFETVTGVTLLGYEPYFYSPTEKGVKIFLSERVKDYQLKKKVRVFPPVGMFSVNRRYQRYRNEYRISGKFVTGQKYKIDLLGGELGDAKQVLRADSFTFTSCGPEPEIRFAADRSLIELHSRQTIPLSFANIGNFKCQMMKVPAYFGPWLDALTIFPEAEEKRPNEPTSYRHDDKTRKALEASAAELDNLMLDCVNRLAALRALEGSEKILGLTEFLTPEFSQTSEGFMGSDDPDKEFYFSVPLDSRPSPTTGGSVIVRVSETDVEDGQQATRLFQVSDLSITYKFSRSELLLWVTSIETGVPVKDVSIMVLSKNDQTLFPGKTDKNGLIRIKNDTSYPSIAWNGNKPSIDSVYPEISDLLIAAAATLSDSSFIRLNTNRFIPFSVQLASPDKKASLGAKARIFTERGVYKQNETVYFKAVVRDYIDKEISAVSEEKVSIKVIDAKGEEIYSSDLELNEFGTCSGSFKLNPYSPLGHYNMRIYRNIDKSDENASLSSAWDFLMNRAPSESKSRNTSSTSKKQQLLGTTDFQVQEFEPPRHHVSISTSLKTRKVKLVVGRETSQPWLECKINGQYYTGGPLRHAKVQWTAYLTNADSSESEYPLFQFGSNETLKELIESGNSVLDSNGELIIALPVSQAVMAGVNSIEISATVLDVDARPATGVGRFTNKPDFKVGIARLPDATAQGQEFQIQTIVVDKHGKRINNGEIRLEIMRKKWFYTQKRDESGGIYYRWESGWMKNQSATRPIKNSRADFDLILAEGGDYMLQAAYYHQGVEYRSSYSFSVSYSFSSFSDYNSQSRTRSENEIMLQPEKTTVQTNEKVKIRYSIPAVCEYALLTRETEEIIEARVVKLDSSQGEFFAQIDEACLPNVFVTLTAPTKRSSFPVYLSQVDNEYPRSYFGFTNIKVQNKVDRLKLEIAPENPAQLKAAPGELFKMGFSVKDKNNEPADAEVLVCVVDEAVLALTGFVTPELDVLTDFVLPLSVFTGDLRTSLISQELFRLLTNRSLTGGDGGAGAITADLDVRRDFRPVAYYNPALRPDKDGNFSIEFNLPDSMTSYRVYAVALDKKATFASEERQLVVSKDFYLEPGLPRFMTAGDIAEFPVNLFNKTDLQGQAECRIRVAEDLSITPMHQNVDLQPFTNNLARFSLSADNGAGESKIIFAGNFKEHTDSIERILPVNPAATIINRNLSGSFSSQKTLTPEIPKYVKALGATQKKGTIKGTLNISTSSLSRIVPSIKYLLRYPYGCVEQTSSGIIPLAAMRKMARQGQIPGITQEQIDAFLEKGVNNLLKMQTQSGGFAYWPGGHSESWWGTQYAVLALSMVKKSGFEFDYSKLKKALAAVRTGLFSSNRPDRFEHGIMALAAVNIAMNGELSKSDLEVLRKKFAQSSDEADVLLLLSEVLGADNKKADKRLAALKPESTSIHRSWQYSTTRKNAFALLAIIAGNGNKSQADEFAGSLLNGIGKKGYWNSTADTGIALLALSDYFSKYPQPTMENAEITVTIGDNEKTVKVDKYGFYQDITEEELLSGQEVKIACNSKGLLNYSLEYSYPDEPERTQQLVKGFIIDKKWQNLNTKEEIRVGDLVKVTIEFEDKFRNEDQYAVMEYLAIEDPIPAGFIPVNSSLKNDSLPPSALENEEAYCGWRSGAYRFYANHQEFHNDRLLAFKNRFWSGRFRLEYYLRAVCEGDFKMKPTKISLMYNPEFYGLSSTARIKIIPQ